MARIDGRLPGFEFGEGGYTPENLKKHEDAFQTLVEASSKVDPDGVSLRGALIRFQVCDGYAHYVVSSDSPLSLRLVPYGDAYEAAPETIRGVDRDTVRRQLVRAREAQESAEKGEAFYASLEPGQVVHYDHGFRQYIRCVVVETSDMPQARAGKALKPVALVGDWRPFNLHRRERNGSVMLGYHAEAVREGRLMTPHESLIYEGPRSRRAIGPDPAGLAPVSLDVPDMTDEERTRAELWRKVDRVRGIASSNAEDPRELLQEIARLVT